jgi:hypothetical protein
LHSEYKDIVAKYPDAAPIMEKVHKVLCDIVSIAGCTPANVGRGKEWESIVESAEQDRRQLCDSLKGKLLFSALYGTYTVTLGNLKSVLQTVPTKNRKLLQRQKKPRTDRGLVHIVHILYCNVNILKRHKRQRLPTNDRPILSSEGAPQEEQRPQ